MNHPNIYKEVSAKRARKLGKRGVYCVYCGSTCNGKARYIYVAIQPQENLLADMLKILNDNMSDLYE